MRRERIRGIESVLEMQFASAFNGLNSRVTAVNCSFGLTGNIEDFGAEELRGRFPNVIRAIAQADTPASVRTIYVWAAGNARGEIGLDGSVESATSVEIVAGLPVRIPELRGHSLAVVATDPEGRIAEFSNRCGIAKKFCLAAPGVGITGPAPSSYCPAGADECWLTFEESGTSSAAPLVTGGIGLLAQHYRNQLGNDEIVARILETADKEGIHEDSEVYGQGFLDLDAATRPAGETRILTGRSLSGPSAPSLDSTLRPGAAFGDSLTRGLALREVASFDELDAPFFRPLSDHLRLNVLAASSVAERLGRLGRDPRGASWRMDGAIVRVRLNAVSTSTGLASPGSLSMTRGLETAGCCWDTAITRAGASDCMQTNHAADGDRSNRGPSRMTARSPIRIWPSPATAPASGMRRLLVPAISALPPSTARPGTASGGTPAPARPWAL